MPNAFDFSASPFDCLDAEEQRVVRDHVDIAYFRADETILVLAPDIANIREKETSLTDLWWSFQQQRVARERGLPIDEKLKQLVRREFPPPARFDFRLNADLS